VSCWARSTTGARRAIVYSLVIILFAGTGAAVAARHVWLQTLPPDQVPACGPGLSYMLETLPFQDVLATVFKGSGECATIDWRFLELAMPAGPSSSSSRSSSRRSPSPAAARSRVPEVGSDSTFVESRV